MDARSTVIAGVVTVLVFGVVIGCVLLVAGRGRDRFDTGRADDLAAAIRQQGLTVCAESTAPARRNGTAVSTQEIRVAAAGDCADAVTIQLDAYRDAAHRDAAARNAEGKSRPRTVSTVFTWHQFTVYLQADDASGDSDVRDRVADALDAVGAR